MWRANRLKTWAIAGLSLAIAGCCGSGKNNRCDLPPETDGGTDGASDGGPDGPVVCGTQVCDTGAVCCLTTSPPRATCIDPANFDSLGCEKMDLPCLVPANCPDGMACCLLLSADRMIGTATCQPLLPCLGGASSYVSCVSNDDCPVVRPMCTPIGATAQGPFSICE